MSDEFPGPGVLFVTATDTGVGKTFVACAVARALRSLGRDVGVMKPVATGCTRGADGELVSDDALRLVEAAGARDPLDLVMPLAFEPPLAPTAAARESGRRFERGRVFEAFGELRARREFLIVEGIGGLLVPLEGSWTVRDLVRELGSPVAIVSRDALGTINHTALTVEAARAAGLDVRGVVLNTPPDVRPDPSQLTNAREIEDLTGARVVARVETCADPAEAAGAFGEEALRALFGAARREGDA